MKTQEFQNQIKATEETYAELNRRLDFSTEIIRNLWRKHFHNFDISMNTVFPWLNTRQFHFENGQIFVEDLKKRNVPLNWRDKRISIDPVYYSNNVRAIAKQARKDYYRAIRERAVQAREEDADTIRRSKAEQEHFEKTITLAQKQWAQQNKLISRLDKIARER